MSIEQIENKKSVQEEFFGSEKYATLKKEVVDSIASVERLETGESDRDIAPAFDYFEKEAVKYGLSELQAEKLFWETVAEEIKETRFRDAHTLIRYAIESGAYSSARAALLKELNKIVEQLSHTLFANLSRKSVALMVLKEKFYKLFLKIEALLEESEEEKRAKIKRPSGQLGEESDEKWEKEKGRYLVEKLKWPVPSSKELVPGLDIALSDLEAKRMERIEFLEYPHFESGDLFVKVKWNGEVGNIKLFDFGLVADVETGLWNSRYKPLFWKVKEKK